MAGVDKGRGHTLGNDAGALTYSPCLHCGGMGDQIQPCRFPAFAAAMADGAAAAGFESQRSLARAAGLDYDETNRYFRGMRLPTLERFAKLTRAGMDPIPLLAAIDEQQEAKT